MKRLALTVPLMGLLAAAVLWTFGSYSAAAGPPVQIKPPASPPGSLQGTIPKTVPLPPGALQKMPPADKPGKPPPGKPGPSPEDWGKFWGGLLGGMTQPPPGYYPPAGAYPPGYPGPAYPPSGYPSTSYPSNVLPSTSAYPPAAPAQAGLLGLLNETGFPINYVLGGSSYSLSTGNAHKYQLAQAAIIEFDRGGSFGLARYTLSPGQYAFSVSDKGWDLHVYTPEVVLVNKTALAVNYRLNGVPHSLTAGNTQRVPADQAATIEFDRGGTFGGAKYSLTPGTYAFTVSDAGWDLHSQATAQ